MNIRNTLILIFCLATISFAQLPTQVEKQENVCSNGLKAMTLLKQYMYKQNLSASLKAVKYLDTAHVLIEKLNKDSLVISFEDFSTIDDAIVKFQKTDYKKILALEKKAPKVRANLEGKILMISKNTFIPLYTYIRILQDLFHQWKEKL